MAELFTADTTRCSPAARGKTWSEEDFHQLVADLESRVFDKVGDDTWFYPGPGDYSTIGAEQPKLPEWKGRGWQVVASPPRHVRGPHVRAPISAGSTGEMTPTVATRSWSRGRHLSRRMAGRGFRPPAAIPLHRCRARRFAPSRGCDDAQGSADAPPLHHAVLSDLTALPVMTKDDLMANFDAVVTDERLTLHAVEEHLAGLVGDGYLFDRYIAAASGGSSGRRGVFVYDWDATVTVFLSAMRGQIHAQQVHPALAGAPPVTAFLGGATPHHMSSTMPRRFSRPGT